MKPDSSHRVLIPSTLLALALALVPACQMPPSNTGENIGKSVEAAKQQMIASAQPEKQRGLPGTTATGVTDNYRQRQTADDQRERDRLLQIKDAGSN